MFKQLKYKMKKSTFTTLFLVLLSSMVYAQKVSINLENVKLEKVLSVIKEQTNLDVAYSAQVVDTERRVTVNVTNDDVTKVLNQIIISTNLKYEIKDNKIYFSEKEERKTAAINVKGQILDIQQQPVIGASIIQQGTTKGVTTDADGNFSITVPGNSNLDISSVGYKKQTVIAQSNMSIILEEEAQNIDDVVVVGYGTTSQRMLTTSVGKVKMDNVDQGNDYNAVKMLQGRVAGVQVSSPSGTPGGTPNIVIRGVSSMGGSTPLYVVDGIPTESFPVINPNDIESMDILKDASAAAIYGSRANNGVVLITTKSGKKGKTTVEFSGRYGVALVAHDIPMANSKEYIRTMEQAIANANAQTGGNDRLMIPDLIIETDWMKEISRPFSQTAVGNGSISGGDDKTTFFASFGYNMQEGYLKKSKYQQYNGRAKFSHKISNWFKFNLNVAGSYSRDDKLEEQGSGLKITRTAREEQPWIGPYNKEAYNGYTLNGAELVRHNPVMLINEEDWIEHKMQGSVVTSLDFTPIKGLRYSPQVSMFGIFDNTFKKVTDKHDARKNTLPALKRQKNTSLRYVIDNIINYENTFLEKFRYSVMVGHSFEKYGYEQFGASSDIAANYPSQNLNTVMIDNKLFTLDNVKNEFTGEALESYIGRGQLNYDNRYILNVSARIDGSSRFSKEKRYGVFPSVSLAWRISEEQFMPKTDNLNDLKLRLSYGQTGSMAGIGRFSTLSLVSAGLGYNGQTGFNLSGAPSILTWERAYQYNGGIDIELFQNRWTLSIDAFYQKNTNLLYGTKPVIASSGVTSINANVGEMQNIGVELMTNFKILTGELKWDAGFNISWIQNKLLRLNEGVDILPISEGGSNLYGGEMHALMIGKPVSAFYMLKQTGIYQFDSDVPQALYAKGVRAGDIQFEDVNGDGDISAEDRQYVGKAIPDFYGGLNTTLSWKGLELSLFTQFSYGGKVMASWKGVNGTEGTEHLGLGRNGDFYNISKYAANNYWNGPGTSNTLPRPVTAGIWTGYSSGYNVQTSTRYLEDASFFRFKTLTLSYTLPNEWTLKAKMSNVKIFASVDNLFTITKYSGYDPETSFDGSPAGANYGIDWGEQPAMRTFLFGVNLSF